MDNAQLRLANFMFLFNKFKEENSDKPQRGMLKLFAEKLELSDRYLSHVKCGRKQIGANTARHVEDKMQLPRGWMDMPHEGAFAGTEGEAMFIETSLALYRNNPAAARELMVEMLKSRLKATKPTHA
jgi:hypothetical protein